MYLHGAIKTKVQEATRILTKYFYLANHERESTIDAISDAMDRLDDCGIEKELLPDLIIEFAPDLGFIYLTRQQVLENIEEILILADGDWTMACSLLAHIRSANKAINDIVVS